MTPITPRGFNLVNSLLFPTPESSYDFDSFPEQELVWLPRSLDPQKPGDPKESMPALFLTSNSARFMMLYLHSNAEDLGRCYHFCNMLRLQFQVNVLAVEYPGYGICSGGQADEESVIANALLGFRFITQVLKFQSEDVILVGRSIGSGPTLSLASKYRVYGVILICPFLSVREVVRHHLGPLSDLIDERFPNKDNVKRMYGSLLIVHGKKDTVVPCSHSEALYEACTRRKRLVTPLDMNHNASLLMDPGSFVVPVLQFFGIPDYTFETLSVPDWVYDKSLSPFFGYKASQPSRKIGDVSNLDGLATSVSPPPLLQSVQDTRAASKSSGLHGSGPGSNVGGYVMARDPDAGEPSTESPDRDDGERSQGDISDFADEVIKRYLASKGQEEDDSQQKPDSPHSTVACKLFAEEAPSKKHGHQRIPDDMPSPPDDAGFFKVPRSQRSGPLITAPIKIPVGSTTFQDSPDCATSWMPAICSMPRIRGASSQDCVTVVAEGASSEAVWHPIGPGARTKHVKSLPASTSPSHTLRPVPQAAAWNSDPDPDPEE